MLVDYNSDDDSDSNTDVLKQQPPPPPVKRTKKILIKRAIDDDDKEEDGDKPNEPVTKKPRASKGTSSLLSMLPAPKQSNSASEKQQQQQKPLPLPTAFVPSSVKKASAATTPAVPSTSASSSTTISTRKPSPPPPVDFFSLSTASNSRQPSTSTSASASTSTSASISISSAPEVPTFKPPTPTPTDPYPGYYQLPSGQWAAHDPAYFSTFMKKWQKEYDAHIRSLESAPVQEDDESVQHVDAAEVMHKAKLEIQQREESKALTQGAKREGEAQTPNVKLTAAKSSGVARSRHQLATMLHDAYRNREMLEEKIAEGKRNRKEAGNKYGF